jgi:hypothetical protein
MCTRHCSGFGAAVCFLTAVTFNLPASARDAWSGASNRFSPGVSSTARFHPHGGWHHGHRGWPVGVYLDRGREAFVNLAVQQTFIAPQAAPAAFVVPSVADLPAVSGIRAAPVAEPARYVINEGRPGLSGAQRFSGPRIMHVTANGSWEAQPDASFGAKIIHLTVPVGLSN